MAEEPVFSCAGQQLGILAGDNGQPAGFAVMEMTIPARFAGSQPPTAPVPGRGKPLASRRPAQWPGARCSVPGLAVASVSST